MTRLLSLVFLITLAISAHAQSSPCVVKYPASLDDLDSLCRAKDNPQGTLAFTITAGATTFSTTASVAAFPTSGLSLKIDNEVILCTTRSGSNFSGCLRGQDGSTATPHVAGSAVRMPILSLHHNTQNGSIVELEKKVGIGSSLASSAAIDDVLMKKSDGTTGWKTVPVLVGGGGISNPGMTIVESDNDSSGDEKTSIRTQGLERIGVSSAASVVSNFQDKGGQLFNVKAYGALCDGSTADTTAIGNAVTAAAAANGAIYLPPSSGGCKIGTATISVPVVSHGGSFLLTTGQTTTFTSTIIAPPVLIFRNALASQGVASFTGNRRLNTIYSEWWGAIADGSTNSFAPLQAAATALKSLTSGILRLNAGNYLTSAAVQFTEVKGIQLVGSGRDNTVVTATGGTTGVQFNGVWRSRIEGITFNTSATITGAAVVEMDGNYDGPHTQGVQGNTIIDCYFNAAQLAPYAFAMTRQGGSGGQGSENQFINSNFDGATDACYYQNGFNALNNQFWGGNFQSYQTDGIRILAGSVQIIGVGFQNAYPSGVIDATQVLNSGFDINTGSAGAGERISVIGCRTESLQFFKGSGTQPGILTGNLQVAATPAWTATTAYSLKSVVLKQVTSSGSTNWRLFRVTTAGTSGGSEPTWPNSGTVADGSITWTETNFLSVDVTTIAASPVVLIENGFLAVSVGTWSSYRHVLYVSSDYSFFTENYFQPDVVVFVDATGGNRTVALGQPPDRQRVTVYKTDTSANTVTVTGDGNGLSGSGVIPGSARGYVTIQWDTTAGPSNMGWIIGKSY